MSETRGEYHTGSDDSAAEADPVPLLGSVTGYAKEVVRNIRRAAISAQMQNFLLEVYARSFGNAGYQRREGREDPGGSCAFDNAAWAHELDMQRQHMYRLRMRAVELGILFYDEEASRLRWNLAFEEWQPLDAEYRRQRYARPGAGRKSNGLRTVASENKSNGLRSPDENKSNGLRQSGIDLIKRVTPASLESAASAAREASLRKRYEERDTKKNDANASGAATSADATPDAPLPASESSPSKKTRELSPKDQYRVDLLARVATINDGAKPPNRAQEWAAAARFWTWGKDGTPADIEQIAACYAEERRRPKWDSGYLSLQSVYSVFAAFLRNPDGFRKAIDRARAAADGTLATLNGHAPPTTRAAPYAANEPKPLPVRRELARDAKPAPLE